MQDLKKKSYLELCEALIIFYEGMLLLDGRLPWPLRIAHSRLQLILCRKVHSLRKATPNFRMPELSRDERRQIIKMCKEFEDDQKLEIFSLTVDHKFMWGFYGLVAFFVAWTLPKATRSKFNTQLLADLPNNILSPGYFLKLLSPLTAHLDAILASALVFLITGVICNFIFYFIDFYICMQKTMTNFPVWKISTMP
jgi:hypothetical protein